MPLALQGVSGRVANAVAFRPLHRPACHVRQYAKPRRPQIAIYCVGNARCWHQATMNVDYAWPDDATFADIEPRLSFG